MTILHRTRLCTYPSCKELVRDGNARCEKHRTSKFYQRTDSVNDAFYKSHKWRKQRERHIKKQPLCVDCNEPAHVVDHIVEIEDWNEGKREPDNFQSLCHTCHNQKTRMVKQWRQMGSLVGNYRVYLVKKGKRELIDRVTLLNMT